MLAVEIIKSKRNKKKLSFAELEFFIQNYTSGVIPDYQMSALLMAIWLNGMDADEINGLTQLMLESGSRVNFPPHPSGYKYVDKHSTGGVGDKTSLVLAPLVASFGVPVPMISGRGLGHTGGTLDKLESIPGFNTQIDLMSFQKMVLQDNLSLIGQTLEICPADKKMYSLRDVTATVESLPLICASIMSKKIAEGIDGLVLDVKWGSGAFMKTTKDAEDLAIGLMKIAAGFKKNCVAMITNMNQPLGRYAGNSLEVIECLAILKNEKPKDPEISKMYEETESLSLDLSSHMLVMGGAFNSFQEARSACVKKLKSGEAYETFAKVCKTQNGRLEDLKRPTQSHDILARESGYITSINGESLGLAGIALKAGRETTSDVINPHSGIEFHVKVGSIIKAGEPIATLWSNSKEDFQKAEPYVYKSYSISEQFSGPTLPLVHKTILGATQ